MIIVGSTKALAKSHPKASFETPDKNSCLQMPPYLSVAQSFWVLLMNRGMFVWKHGVLCTKWPSAKGQQ